MKRILIDDFPAAFSLQEKLRKEKEHRIQQTTVPSLELMLNVIIPDITVEIDPQRG